MAVTSPAVELALEALRLVRLGLPHLAGLASLVRVHADARIPTAAVTASGRILVNPEWFPGQPVGTRVFVVAHELLHLCLRTHERSEGGDRELWNYAHDYIINDMLRRDLGTPVPAGGLDYEGACTMSGELLVEMLRSGKLKGPSKRRKSSRSAMGQALADAGLLPPEPEEEETISPGSGDVIGRKLERELFPDIDLRLETSLRRRVEAAALQATTLEAIKAASSGDGPRGDDTGGMTAAAEALHTAYRPPWERALQRWFDAVAPGPRTYSRPSRRGADRADLVLPGRTREGWTLHVVLDTSGSMAGEIPRMLGALASFAEGANVAEAHVLQCDVAVTRNEWLPLDQMSQVRIDGLGGSDMSPALELLALDPEVEAVVVLTDGGIDYPREPLPYEVLWALDREENARYFTPPYGAVLALPLFPS